MAELKKNRTSEGFRYTSKPKRSSGLGDMYGVLERKDSRLTYEPSAHWETSIGHTTASMLAL